MPRYEQLKAKSKGISYTRQIRNESKEINLKKPIIISITFIIIASVIFTVVKKYSPMVDIAIKDFFSINHKEALVLESDGITEDQNKMSFLNNIPLFNFFIKTDTNETLSVMTYETNSKIEAALDNINNSITNSNIITRESLLPFFNNNIENNNSIVSDNTNYESIIFSDTNATLNRIPETNNSEILNTNTAENIIEDEKTYNYLEKIILENRNNNTQNTNTKNSNTISQSQKSIFDDILKPKTETKRETTTMKPSSTTTFSTKAPPSYVENTKKNNSNTNETYNFDINQYLTNNNNARIIKNDRDSNRMDIMKTSVYSMTNSLDKPNVDYNRVINDMVSPNNNVVSRENNNYLKNEEDKTIIKPTIEDKQIIEDKTIIKENTLKNNDIKKEIMQKAQNDINNYNIKKANNNITRDLKERKLKENSNEGIYLVEYNESTGSITLIFRERKFNNKSSVEEAIKELLIGATDEENRRNIISCIPKDTELIDIFIENNTVYLNFNENFEFNPLGNEGTMVQIYQFVYTATQFEGIDNVIFLVNGKLNETIGSEGAIENMPFRRFQ